MWATQPSPALDNDFVEALPPGCWEGLERRDVLAVGERWCECGSYESNSVRIDCDVRNLR